MRPDRRAFLSGSFGGLLLGGAALTVEPDEGQEPFDRELARLRRVDAGLIGFDEIDRIVLELDDPVGIAVGGANRLYAVGDQALMLFVDRRLARRTPLRSAPSCVGESPDGNAVYVGCGDHVEVLRSDGTSRAVWPACGATSIISSLAVARDQIFVADAGRKEVRRHDLAGREVGRVGEVSGRPAHFLVPSPFLDLALAPSGVLWVTNPGRHRVECFTLEGRALRSLGTSGAAIDAFCGCCNPTHIAVLPDGRIVTAEKGLPRVKILRPSGELDTVVAADQKLAQGAVGLDLATDDAGNVLVLDPRERAVRVFAPRRGGGSHGG